MAALISARDILLHQECLRSSVEPGGLARPLGSRMGGEGTAYTRYSTYSVAHPYKVHFAEYCRESGVGKQRLLPYKRG